MTYEGEVTIEGVRYLPLKQAATLLGVHEVTVRKWLSSRSDIESIKYLDRQFLAVEWIEREMEDRCDG
jgi:hypothetical protein